MGENGAPEHGFYTRMDAEGWMGARNYDSWFAELASLAHDRGLEWIVQRDAQILRDSYARGVSPDEELAALADMAEWRGCGCGGT